MFKTNLTTCKIQIKVQILTKNLILKHLSMYRTIQYDSYYTYTISYDLYDMPIRYKIFYTRYDMYCVSYDPYRVFYNIANYGYIGVTDLEIFFLFLFLQTNSSENP